MKSLFLRNDLRGIPELAINPLSEQIFDMFVREENRCTFGKDYFQLEKSF